MNQKNKSFRAKVYVLGDNIDTDQIIPANYLNLVPTIPEEYAKLGSYAMAGLPETLPPFTDKATGQTQYGIMIAGKNFGCGSSREHAPIAIKASGVSCVIASSFARIFFRNSFNMGLPIFESDEASAEIKEGDIVEVDASTGLIMDVTTGKKYQARPIPRFMQELIEDGGLMEHILKRGGI